VNAARERDNSVKTAGAPAWLQALLVLVVGGLSGALAIVALSSSSQGGILVVAAVAASAALAVVLGLGEVRRPLLAILAFSLPLHLDIYLGKFPLSFAYGPIASLGRLAGNDLILAALLFLWLGEMAIGRQKRIELFPRMSAPALLFIGLGVLSIVFVQEPRLSIYQTLELVKGFLLFLYVANRVQDESDLKWLLAGLMAAVLFQGGLGLYQAVMQRPLGLEILGERIAVRHHILESQVTVRPSGTLWHPNHLAMYLELVLPVIGAVLLAPGATAHGQPGISWRWRLAAVLALTVGLATVVFTLSRGTWLSLCVAAAVLVWWGVRNRTLPRLSTAVGLAGLLIILVLLNALTGSVIVERLTGPDLGSAQSRVPLMRGAVTIIADHPLLGSGLNNYENAIQIYDSSGEFTGFGLLPVVHNLFLLIAAEVGLLGLGAFLWLVAVLGRTGVRYLREQSIASLAAAVVAGLLAGGLASMLHQMVDFGLLGDPQLTYTFWFLAGLLTALSGHRETAGLQ
jgi:putative inorganic carbon (hco3(-)) transporter